MLHNRVVRIPRAEGSVETPDGVEGEKFDRWKINQVEVDILVK